MVDTVRTVAYLQNALRDGLPDGAIVQSIIRDFVVSTMSMSTMAATGTTQGTAAALSALITIVTSVPSGTGVILSAGIRACVMNRGANPLLIYPPASGQLESLGTNVAFTLQPGLEATILFDPNNPSNGYVSTAFNLASLPTSLPATAGVLWINGGVLSVS